MLCSFVKRGQRELDLLEDKPIARTAGLREVKKPALAPGMVPDPKSKENSYGWKRPGQ